ncbi:hypothetical protein [Mycobacterium sp. 155]|uniref:Rv1733c family protein n=1 Tax=Mycobacterium sp. 155 TaxID=1157943 RepID=UPI0003663B97|nr:hypothetical protein [Mycobacterium sp. 155]
METFTLSAGTWIRRLVTRSALIRASDRIEAAAALLISIFVVLAVPVAGAMGTTTYDSRTHEYAAQRLTDHHADAIATDHSSPDKKRHQDVFVTPVQWRWAGQRHVDTIQTTTKMKPGDREPIWVDAAGNRTVAPPTDHDAAVDAATLAISSWLIVAGTGAAVLAVVHNRVERRRYAEWDRELEDLAENGRTNRS